MKSSRQLQLLSLLLFDSMWFQFFFYIGSKLIQISWIFEDIFRVHFETFQMSSFILHTVLHTDHNHYYRRTITINKKVFLRYFFRSFFFFFFFIYCLYFQFIYIHILLFFYGLNLENKLKSALQTFVLSFFY